MRGTEVVNFRLSDTEKKVFDILAALPVSKNNRAFFKNMITGYLAAYSYMICESVKDYEKDIPDMEKRVSELQESFVSETDEAKKQDIDILIKVRAGELGVAKQTLKALKELTDLFLEASSNARPFMDSSNIDSVNLYEDGSRRRAVHGLVSAYRCNTDPKFRKNMEMNGFLPQASQEDQE